MMLKKKLRQAIRQRRRALSQLEQQQASFYLVQNIRKLPELKRFKRFAIYFPCNGEISLLSLLDYFKKHNKITYLPIIKRKKMYFMR